ncbi:MAG: methyltransferase [Clostridiales bacterium]|nr:methyltransferase [Clostridiales bacterium]
MKANEFKVENLGNGIQCQISKEHCFGTDAMLLENFAMVKAKDICCDLGTGCGIIPLLMARDGAKYITAVEIQLQGINQLLESIKLSGLKNIITPVHSDLKELKGKVPFGIFDLVTMNPPYTAIGSGILSVNESDKFARHENACKFEDICECASHLLKYGGRLCMCLRPHRLCELFKAMNKFNIEPKRIRQVAKSAGNPPWLILVEGRLGGKSGLIIESEMHIYSSDGNYSEEMEKIYAPYSNKGKYNEADS